MLEPTDDNLTPSTDQASIHHNGEPGETDKQFEVPNEIVSAGEPTNTPRDDSPESLDEEIAQGADRENIDPHHSITRPAIDNIDEEEHGVN